MTAFRFWPGPLETARAARAFSVLLCGAGAGPVLTEYLADGCAPDAARAAESLKASLV